MKTKFGRGFGRRLRAMRLAAKMSQTDMASAMKVSRGYLSDVERGESQFSLHRFAEVYPRLRRAVRAKGHVSAYLLEYLLGVQ